MKTTAHVLTSTEVKAGDRLSLIEGDRAMADNSATAPIGVSLEDGASGGIVQFVIAAGVNECDLRRIEATARAEFIRRCEAIQ